MSSGDCFAVSGLCVEKDPPPIHSAQIPELLVSWGLSLPYIEAKIDSCTNGMIGARLEYNRVQQNPKCCVCVYVVAY